MNGPTLANRAALRSQVPLPTEDLRKKERRFFFNAGPTIELDRKHESRYVGLRELPRLAVIAINPMHYFTGQKPRDGGGLQMLDERQPTVMTTREPDAIEKQLLAVYGKVVVPGGDPLTAPGTGVSVLRMMQGASEDLGDALQYLVFPVLPDEFGSADVARQVLEALSGRSLDRVAQATRAYVARTCSDDVRLRDMRDEGLRRVDLALEIVRSEPRGFVGEIRPEALSGEERTLKAIEAMRDLISQARVQADLHTRMVVHQLDLGAQGKRDDGGKDFADPLDRRVFSYLGRTVPQFTKNNPEVAPKVETRKMKECIACHELILARATKCRWCQEPQSDETAETIEVPVTHEAVAAETVDPRSVIVGRPGAPATIEEVVNAAGEVETQIKANPRAANRAAKPFAPQSHDERHAPQGQ